MFRRRLAGYNKNGTISINPHVKGDSRTRLKRHMQVYQKERNKGESYAQARRKALNAEHRGMTKKQVFQYEGYMGAIARYYPAKRH